MTGRSRRPAPTWEEIADAIEVALDASLIDLTIRHDGHPAELYSLARCLDKAGLIDWSGVRPGRLPGDRARPGHRQDHGLGTTTPVRVREGVRHGRGHPIGPRHLRAARPEDQRQPYPDGQP